MGFRDYLVWRRGTVAPAELYVGLFDQVAETIDDLDRAAPDHARMAEVVTDDVYRMVPAASGADRSALLRLRRDVHNDRWPAAAGLRAAQRLLTGAAAEQLAAWLASWTARDKQLARAREDLAAGLRDSRRALAAVLDKPDMLDSLLLSGAELRRSLRAYAETACRGQRPRTARERGAERTALAFAHRAACKPVPFGALTEVGAQPWHAAPAAGRRIRVARLNRGLLTWMAGELHRIDGRDRLLLIRLNNTVAVAGDEVTFVRRGADGTAASMSPERFVRTPRSAPLDAVREVLAGAGAGTSRAGTSRAEIIGRLVHVLRATDAAVGALLDRLVAAGLCEQDLGIPDQCERYAEAVARALRGVRTEQADRCAEVFDALQRIEDDLPSAPPENRPALLQELAAQKRRFAAVSGAPRELAELPVARSDVFEDVGRTGPARGWRPGPPERNAEAFRLLARLLPLLDDSTVVRLGLYAHFTAGQPAALLDYWRVLAALPPQRLSQVMTGAGDPHVATVLDARHRLLAALGEMAAAHGPDGTLHLDPGWLAAFLDDLPPWLAAWDSFAARLQLTGDDLVVLNEAMTGHGVFFSRFCGLLPPEPDGWSLRGAVTAAVHACVPAQADLTAVLGLNISLHPRLAPRELVYPGSVPQPGGDPIGLRDVAIAADPAHRRLMVTTADGTPLTFVPMSFLFPAAAPPLYRFLCALAPIRSVSGGWWERLLAAGHRAAALPRLALGDVVLDRACRIVPAADVPATADAEELAGHRRMRRWQRDAGLDDRCFFRVRQLDETPSGDWVEQTRRWARDARRARATKRQYLDFRQPLLVGALLHRVAEQPDAHVLFQECLPDPGAGPAAEEYLVEWTSQEACR